MTCIPDNDGTINISISYLLYTLHCAKCNECSIRSQSLSLRSQQSSIRGEIFTLIIVILDRSDLMFSEKYEMLWGSTEGNTLKAHGRLF